MVQDLLKYSVLKDDYIPVGDHSQSVFTWTNSPGFEPPS